MNTKLDWAALFRVITLIGGFVGAVGAIIAFYTMMDWPVLATRGYVDAQQVKANEARSEIVGAVIELARDQRDRLRRTRDGLVARMAAATDTQIKADLQLLVEQSTQDVMDVDTRIMTLEQFRGKHK